MDGVLVTDMIVEEAGEYLRAMKRRKLAPVFLAAPTSPDERLRAIATHSRGFVYAISRTGITGTQQRLPATRDTGRPRCAFIPSCRWPSASASPTPEHFAEVAGSPMPRSSAARSCRLIEQNPGREAAGCVRISVIAVPERRSKPWAEC